MSPAERLRHDFLGDVYWPAASACEREYRDFYVERVFVAGEVVDAGQSQYLSAFTECYHRNVREGIEQRRRAGQALP
jgi:hypothetical protein